MAGTAQQALDKARSYLGYVEGPRNNETIMGAYTGYNFQPWCGSYTKFVLDKTGTVGEPSPVYTPSGVVGYQKVKRWIPRSGSPQPGDLGFIDFQGGQSASGTDHVVFVEEVLADGRIQTLEGNTSSGDSGSQSNGGGVYRRIRPRGVFVGFGRPAYAPEPAQPAPVPVPQPEVDWAAVRRLAAGSLLQSMKEQPNMDGNSHDIHVAFLRRVLNFLDVTPVDLNEASFDYNGDVILPVVIFQNNVNKMFPGAITDFPGAVHETTRFFMVVALQNIANGVV